MQSLANAEGKLQICQPPLSGERPWWIVAVRRDVNQLQLWLNGEKEADASILGDPGKYNNKKVNRESGASRIYGKHCLRSLFLFLLSSFKRCSIVIITYLLSLKHPNKSFLTQ